MYFVEPIQFQRPTLEQGVLFFLILLASVIDLPGGMNFGNFSGLGMATMLAAGLVWVVWLSQPVLPSGILVVMLPLIFFEMDALGTIMWFRPDQSGIQLLVVSLTFLGLTMLSARVVAQQPEFGLHLLRGFVYASLITCGLYVLKWYRIGPGNEGIVGDRSFGLGEMAIVACLLALWRGQNWPDNTQSPQPLPYGWFARQIPVIWAAIIMGLILISLSRTALVIVLLLCPLAVALRGNKKSVFNSILILLIGATMFGAAILSYQPLYNRFFHEDAAIKVGGVTISSSGRTQIWDALLTRIGDDWLFGKGVSSSEAMLRARFQDRIGHPHNDFLRFYFDQGIFGLSLWLIFLLVLGYHLVGNLRRSIRDQSPGYPLHLAALLALTAVSLSMITDNSVGYSFVMAPLAIILGSSLGAGSAQRALLESPPGFDVVYAQDIEPDAVYQ